MLKTFIDRPILSTVLSILILMLGVIGLFSLPVTRFPDIAPPSVNVSASYPGADAKTIANSVLLPLESEINGVEGMSYIRSKASTGSASINVFFKQGTNPNEAAVNVQTKVSKAYTNLPGEVVEGGVTVEPQQQGAIMTLNIYSEDTALDETFLQSYTNINIIRELQRINGVAKVTRIGARNYAVRIWLNPNKLRAFNLEPNDIMQAVKEQNIEIAPGEFGQNSAEAFQITLKYEGRFTSIKEFEDIILKSTDDEGSMLRLKDVARVELSATNLQAENRVNGLPGLTINITQSSGSNAREIDIAIQKKLKELSKDFPSGMKYTISYSVKDQVNNSMRQVIHTLIEAFILVFLIIFIFLQNIRASLIPAIAIIVSLVGTFFFIYLLGFSINMLTMFALILAIGIVVDDAIVVVEAIYEKLREGNHNPYTATVETMQEIGPAIFSITLVMAAVFVPVGFMQGPAGVFYRQFAYTLAVAILISAFNAVTLSPALCALYLRINQPPERAKSEARPPLPDRLRGYLSSFFAVFNNGFEKLKRYYLFLLVRLLKRPLWAIGGLVFISAIGFLMMRATPTAFIPDEDNSFIVFSLKLQPGASLARTNSVLKKALSKISHRKEIMSMSSSAGYNTIDNSTSSSYAMGYINMYPQHQRKGIRNIEAFIDTLRADLADVHEAEVSIYSRPTVEGFGDQNGVRFVIEDKFGNDFQSLGTVSKEFLTKLNEQPEVLQATTTFEPDFPQMELVVDKEKVKMLGIDINHMLNNVRQYYSRVKTSEFNLFNRLNFVYIQGEPDQTSTAASLANIYVRNKSGNMVPVSTVIRLRETYGPEVVTRYNMYNSVEISALPAKGYSTGRVMETINETTMKELPGNYKHEWTGLSLEESKASSQTAVILLLSVLFVYFLLSAKYESYLLPLAILLSVPVGLIGVFTLVNIVGLQNNIYIQIALLMLIGLLGKNAILIIEYSLQARRAGAGLLTSAIRGARLRLRPILMTSLAFITGMVPLMWSSGPSAQGNHSISFGAAGGMLSGVLLGIFIIPILYVLFQSMDEKIKAKSKEYRDD